MNLQSRLLLMFSTLSVGQFHSHPTKENEQQLFASQTHLEYAILVEINQTFESLSTISLATDTAVSNASTLQFSLGNSAATDQLGLQVNKIEHSIARLSCTIPSSYESRCLLDVIKLTTMLYINVFIRYIPRPAALNNMLASKAIRFLRILCSRESNDQKNLLLALGKFALFAFSMLIYYMKEPNFQASLCKDAAVQQLHYVFLSLCDAHRIDTPEALLSTIQSFTTPTTYACAEIKRSFQTFSALYKQV